MSNGRTSSERTIDMAKPASRTVETDTTPPDMVALASQADSESRAALEKQTAEVAAKYDAESRTRKTEWKPLGLLISGMAIFTALYHLYTAYFGPPPTLIHRSLHVSLMLFLVFMLYPPTKRATAAWLRIPDTLLAAAALVPTVYLWLNYEEVLRQAGRFTGTDVLISTLMVVLVVEATRRVAGWALPVLAVLFIMFGLFGRDMPGVLRHRGYDWDTLAYSFFATTEGIFSIAIGVSSTYIILFILFGAILAKCGMSLLFNDLALAVAGQTRGGPAKVATIASGFMGSINGSAVANVVSTGVFTIPLMKKLGYSRTFAGAVESTASTGGQILPPIMGASAFIMAETLGVPYSQVAVAAIVPAFLYYISLIIQIHLRATRLGLKGISKDNLPLIKDVLKDRGHLLIPLGFLLYMLFFSGRTILYSAFLTIVVTVVVSMLRKTTRLSFRELLQSLEDGTKQAVGVAIACACVGIVVGVVSLSGFGVMLASALVSLSGGVLLFTLFLTMIACLVLGMGLPTVPAYIITATMAAPALVELGVEPLVAHLFVFYFGLLSNITPPVALAAFAAAGISGGSMMRTSVDAVRLAAAGFLLPYIFVYSPELLLRDVNFVSGVAMVVIALIGIALFGTAIEGHFMEPMHWVSRIIMATSAAFLLLGGPDLTVWVLLGVVGSALVLGVQIFRAKRNNNLRIKAI